MKINGALKLVIAVLFLLYLGQLSYSVSGFQPDMSSSFTTSICAAFILLAVDALTTDSIKSLRERVVKYYALAFLVLFAIGSSDALHHANTNYWFVIFNCVLILALIFFKKGIIGYLSRSHQLQKGTSNE